MIDQNIRKDIVQYARRMYADKLVSATSGNISVRIPDRENAFAITPSSEDYVTMTEDRIVIMTFDGTILESANDARPSSEWRLHAEIYRARKDVKAVVHTHSPYATAFAVVRQKIPMILIEMKPWLGGEVLLSEYAPTGTLQLARNVARDLGDRNCCLMANHGVVAVASNLDLAYVRAAYVEDAARIYHLAKCMGTPYVIPENVWGGGEEI